MSTRYKVEGAGELEELTAGEIQLLVRRRAGWSQSEYARRLGISYNRLSRWERDIEEPVGLVPLTSIESHERCLLYRRRSGETQDTVAQALGRCRNWVNLMERGLRDCTELLCHWEQ